MRYTITLICVAVIATAAPLSGQVSINADDIQSGTLDDARIPDTITRNDQPLDWDGIGSRSAVESSGSDHGLIVRNSSTGGNAVVGWSLSGSSAVKAIQEDHATSPAVNIFRDEDIITTKSDAPGYNVFQSGEAPVFAAEGGYGNPDFEIYANKEDGYRVDLDGETVDRGRVGFAASEATTGSGSGGWVDQTFATEDDDTHDAWDGTEFTAPYAGIYRVDAVWRGGSVTSGTEIELAVTVGSKRIMLDANDYSSAASLATLSGSTVIQLDAGDTVKLQTNATGDAVSATGPTDEIHQTFSVYLN